MDLNSMNAALMDDETRLTPEGSKALAAGKAAAETALAASEAALAAIRTAAKALTDKLESEDATIEGCAAEIAALKALYPAA